MLEASVAKKYATALFQVAKRNDVAETVHDEMRVVAAAVVRERRFLDFLTAPQVTDQDKFAMVRGALGERVTPLVLHFLLFVVEKRRIVLIERMAEHYEHLYDEDRGVIEVVIATARPMTDDERTRLIEKIGGQTGKSIRPVTKVEPKLIGGVVVRIGHQVVDGSVRTKLVRLRDQLMRLKVH